MRNILTIVLFITCLSAHAGSERSNVRADGTTIPQKRNPALEMVGNAGSTGKPPVTDVHDVFSHSRRDEFVNIMSATKAIGVGTLVHSPCVPLPVLPICAPVAGPLAIDQLEFLRSFSKRTLVEASARQVPGDCRCLREQLSANKDAEVFENEKKLEREKLNKLIQDSLARKMVNDFSINLEDASFFLNQAKPIFSNYQTAAEIQCLNPASYKAKVTETCGSSHDEAYLANRMQLMMKGTATTFERSLEIMSTNILQANVTTELARELNSSQLRTYGLEAAGTRTYAREQYDNLRGGLRTSDKGTYLDIAIGHIMRDPSFAQRITTDLNAGKVPYEIIFNILKENKNNSQFITNTGVGTANFRRFFSTDVEIDKSLGFIVTIHPGMMLALKDRAIFEKTVAGVRTNSRSPINTLDSDKTIIEPHMRKSCDDLIRNFAVAVCTPDEKLLSSIKPEDLERLVHESEGTERGDNEGAELHQLLLCEAQSGQTPTALTLPEVSRDSNLRSSDYVLASRPSGAGGTSGSTISQIAGLVISNPEMRTDIERFTERGRASAGAQGRIIPGTRSSEVYAQAVLSGRSMEVGRGSMSKDDARQIIADNQRYDEQRGIARSDKNTVPASSSTQAVTAADPAEVVAPVTNTAQIQAPQVVAPIVPSYVANQTTVAANAQAARDREALRDYVANKDSSGDSVRAVDSMDDETVQELNRLRGEKQTLLEQNFKEGNARLEDMRKRLADITALTNRAPASTAVEANSDDDAIEDENSDPASSARNPRAPEVRPGAASQIASNQNLRSVGGASTGGSSGSAIVNPNGASDANVAPSTNGNQASSNAALQVTGSLTISGVKTGVPQQQELNQEVQKFLESSDLNASAIQDIKTKGIKIRYSVMENNQLVQKEVLVKYENLDIQTRNAIDLKLARKTVSNQVSKLAVLRLIMGNNQPR